MISCAHVTRLLGLFHTLLSSAHPHTAAVCMPNHHIACRYSYLRVLSSVFLMIFSPVFFFFTQEFKCFFWGYSYYQGQQLPGPEGAPQGFVRWEIDGSAGYIIAEYVDGKEHGHVVCCNSAGIVKDEWDMLRGVIV